MLEPGECRRAGRLLPRGVRNAVRLQVDLPVMNEQDAVDWAEEKGLRDGEALAPYSPPIRWLICEEADDAYRSAYFHAMVRWDYL